MAGLTGTVRNVRVTLVNVGHSFPDDLDILLVGPGGQNAILMSDAGGGDNIASTNITFDDNAASNLPDGSIIDEGTYRPSNFSGGDSDNFPGPAPAPSGGSALSVFNGINPNGTWSRYVVDDASQEDGAISTGWFLDFWLNRTSWQYLPRCAGNGRHGRIGGSLLRALRAEDVSVARSAPRSFGGRHPDPPCAAGWPGA